MAEADGLPKNAVEWIFVSRRNWCSGVVAHWTRLRRGVVGGLGLRRGRLVVVFCPVAAARRVCEGCEEARREEEEERATLLPYL